MTLGEKMGLPSHNPLWWMSQNEGEAQPSSPCRHGPGGVRHRIPCFRMESVTLQGQVMDTVHTVLQALQLCPWGMLEGPHLPRATLCPVYMQPVWWPQSNSVSNLELPSPSKVIWAAARHFWWGGWMSFPNSVCQTRLLTFPRKSAPQQSTWWRQLHVPVVQARTAVLHYISLLISSSDLRSPKGTHSQCSPRVTLCMPPPQWSCWSQPPPPGPVTVGIYQLLSCFSLVPCNHFSAQFFFI